MSCKTLLAAALAGAIALEELSIECIPGNSRMPLSALEVIASNWPQWATSLVKLRLNLVNDLQEDSFPMSVRMMTAHLVNFTALVRLQLSLLNIPALYFKQLAKALPIMGLQTLDLQNISSRYRYIAKFLKSCKDTLRSFSLSQSTFVELKNFYQLIRQCTYRLELRKCNFRGSNAGDKGLHFGDFNELRPQTVEGLSHSPFHLVYNLPLESEDHQWVSVYTTKQDAYAIELDSDKGDDVKYWLDQVHDCVELKWIWSQERFI
ncbi:hypothetical protein HBH56_149930 [Parastagonospora nodorum]|nr:hypothetical protein HBH56_149930 [Parastagonospora nodorum]KAH3928656.1 hypothetical protein HBH54_135830 [Parastagonospora nodorum]KAH4142287.1 hypothetical protein HBH45_054420 [Parastagonospora nodorum]KAH4156104.1 hypothetical protein HBH44_131160 [Parastagonospora nodorum]KAH4267561.1 hypothetical protein HBI03_065800 [Parastagonospora nodorum]